MQNKSIKKYFLFFLEIIVFSICLFAQEKTPENADKNIETTEKQVVESDIDEMIQDNLVIIEAVHQHELNPQITSYASDSQLLCGLYEGLFSYNPRTLEPQYAIATSYRISRDKKRWSFTINPKAYFSNGEKITAQSVRDSWLQLLATPEAPYSSLFDVVKNAEQYRKNECSADDVGIYATSDTTLSIHLEKPANYLPKVLCHSAFSVIHRNPTVYSGAFYLDDCDEKTYILKKNQYYWDKENTHLKQITFIQSDDNEENTFTYNTGLANWITGNVNTDNILNKKTVQLSAEFATSYLFFKDSCKKPSYVAAGVNSVWDYVEFRNALFEAIPWDILREYTYVPATTFVYPLNGYPQVEGYSYTDAGEALNLMKAAREKYGIAEDQILPLVMDISENSFSEDKLQALKDAWSVLGVDLQIRTYPSFYYLKSVPQSDADLFCYVWIGDFADPLAFLELFRGSSSLNDSGWKNPIFDELLEKAAVVSDEERVKLLAQAEQIILDSYIVVPVQHPVALNIINLNEIGGWYSNAFDIHPLKYLFKKSVKVDLPNIVMKPEWDNRDRPRKELLAGSK